MPFDRVFCILSGRPFCQKKSRRRRKGREARRKIVGENETSVKEGTGEVEPQKPPERKRRKTDKNKENEKQEDTENEKQKLTLLTDYYELTMMYGYFKKQMTKTQSVFDLFFQSKQREQLLHCGRLEQAVQYIENLRFEKTQLDYLRSTGDFDEDFLNYLENFRFSEIFTRWRRELWFFPASL